MTAAPPPEQWAQPPLPPMPPVSQSLDQSSAQRSEQQRKQLGELASSLTIVIGWFAVAGLVGALIWVKVTPLPEFTRVATTGTMDEEQLSHQFSTSGWFLVIAVVGGLVSGLALLLLRRGSPVVMVLLVGAGGALATLLMVQCGLAWGPGNVSTALAHAKLGEKVPVQLKSDVKAIYYAWSIAALLGAALALWILDSAANRRNRRPAASGPT